MQICYGFHRSDETFEDLDMSIEKLPMQIVVIFNEMAKERNITLNQLIIQIKKGIQIEKNKWNKLNKVHKETDESEISFDKLSELFKDRDMSIEKLPMMIVVSLNEMAKEENITLDQTITAMKINIQIGKNNRDNDGEMSCDDMVQFTFAYT